MSDARLVQEEKLSIKISQHIAQGEHHQLDLYFSLPNEMGVGPNTLKEEDYYHSSIRSRGIYSSAKLHLPLVKSRLISKKKGALDDYRVNLNLFSYQMAVALETDVTQLLKEQEAGNFYPVAGELAELSTKLLKKLRRNQPTDEKLQSYFVTVDNYLSWHTEQQILRLLSHGPKKSEFNEPRNALLTRCREEAEYRSDRRYNSQATINDPNRIANKMRLLRRLIEHGVVFKKETRELGKGLKNMVKGMVTALLMMVVMTLVLKTRSSYSEITLTLVAILAVIYGIREIFKDDVNQMIWRRIQRGRPKWSHRLSDSATQNRLADQTVWLEYIKDKQLPSAVATLLHKRRRQNKQSARLLHFRIDTRVAAKGFQSGYNEIQERVHFNLRPFIRYLKRGEGQVYAEDGGQILKNAIEQRYQINIITGQRTNRGDTRYQRYKLTLNRSQIIALERVDQPLLVEANGR